MDHPMRSDRERLKEARAVARRAQTPARDATGAIARTRDGLIFPGVSIRLETCAALSVCAEQVALSSAVAATDEPIEEIALWVPAGAGEHPCGHCLQVWLELAPQARFVFQRGEEEPRLLDLKTLLPDPFAGRSRNPRRVDPARKRG
jgi:cytidine deaminase